MKLKSMLMAAAVIGTGLAGAASTALAADQFFPALVYRTGAYAPNGVPFANGYVDYLKLINAKGGINGVKVSWEECETGYATAKGVECYERMKGKEGGATVFQPLSTGITFALTEKAPDDKTPLITSGYGLAASADGLAFKWNFALLGTYWTGASVLEQHLKKINGGSLKGKSIALIYHDSPYGKEPIPMLEELAKQDGFSLDLLPVAHPGIEQKATWLKIRQARPYYILLWGWGVMNSAALKEAVATGYPREKMYGVWWSGAEPDVKDVGMGAKGYNALTMQDAADANSKIIKDVLSMVHDKGQGTGPREEVGQVLYMRGVIAGMVATEGVRRAQERFGKGKVMTGEQARWGYENLALDAKKLEALGFGGVTRPFSTSCADHMGAGWARLHTWDGTKWSFSSDWYEADDAIIRPLVRASAEKYAAEKKMQRRSPQDCQS